MLSAQKQAEKGAHHVLRESDIDSYLRDMASRNRRKGTLENYHRCLEDFLDWLPEGKELFRRGSTSTSSIWQGAIRRALSI